jgi:hypothetical protein
MSEAVLQWSFAVAEAPMIAYGELTLPVLPVNVVRLDADGDAEFWLVNCWTGAVGQWRSSVRLSLDGELPLVLTGDPSAFSLLGPTDRFLEVVPVVLQNSRPGHAELQIALDGRPVLAWSLLLR